MTKFSHNVTIRFQDADPAGILFYGHIFGFAHEAYERFVEHLGIQWIEWFGGREYIVPVKWADGEFFKPLFPGKPYRAEISVLQLRDSSFELQCSFMSAEGEHARVKTVHVFADPKTKTKINIPTKIHDKLKPFVSGK